jgi:hypothetical protein
MNLKAILYAFACLSFSVVIGAAVYEHLAVVPQWSAGPPFSLSMFQGKYGLNAAAFWIPIHPVTLLLLMGALVCAWKTDGRKHVLITLAGYVTILGITAVYFVPELLAITGTAFSETIDPSLTQRAQLWELMSLVRLSVLVVLAIVLFVGLTRLHVSRVAARKYAEEIGAAARVKAAVGA